MLLTIQRPSQGGSAPEVTRALLDCHLRIRTFGALGRMLADAPCRTVAPPRDEVATSAGLVVRYFTVALPKHVEDEDRSLLPRLLAAEPELERPLARMRAEHREIEELLAALVPLWSAIAKDPACARGLAPRLAPGRDLERLLEAHLGLEEREIFPAIARLGDAERAAVQSEMGARRRD